MDEPAHRQPNILVFVADDLGWRGLGAYGSDAARTPNIDRLAKRGLKVERAFLTTSSCSPSRISMLSGRHPHETGTEDLHTGLPDSVRTVPWYLSEAGYHTGVIGKVHGPPHDHFDWRNENWRSTGVSNFRSFLDAADADQPFFMWAGFIQPHRPFGGITIDAPTLSDTTDPSSVEIPPYLAARQTTRRDLANYHDAVAQMDLSIGNYLDVLETRGLRKNTNVVFLSDNGAPFPRGKGTVYDAGVRTPLIFEGPGVDEGATYQGLVSTIDLAPTLLDLANVSPPSQLTGKTVTPILQDQSVPGRKYAFSQRNWHGTDEHIRSVRTDRYRFVLNAYTHLPLGTPSDVAGSPSWRDLRKLKKQNRLTPAQQRLLEVPRPRVELYDLEKDPWEIDNVANERGYVTLTDSLAQVLQNWRERTNDHLSHERRRPDTVDRTTGTKFRDKKYDFIDGLHRR